MSAVGTDELRGRPPPRTRKLGGTRALAAAAPLPGASGWWMQGAGGDGGREQEWRCAMEP